MNVIQYMYKYGCIHMVYVIYTLSLNVSYIFLNIFEHHHSVRRNTYISEWLMIYCKWQYIANQCVLIMDRVSICNGHFPVHFKHGNLKPMESQMLFFCKKMQNHETLYQKCLPSFFLIKIPEFFHHISGFNLLKPFHVEMFSNRVFTVVDLVFIPHQLKWLGELEFYLPIVTW